MKYKRISAITETLENRRSAVANMVALGYSAEQISSFFECPLRGIKETLEAVGIPMPTGEGKKEDEMDLLFQLRDKKIAEMSSAYGEAEALKRLGFTHVPYYRNAAARIAEENFGPELTNEAYMSAFNGISKKEAKKVVGVKSIAQMEEAGYEYKEVAKRGEAYRRMVSVSPIIERLLNRVPQTVVSRETGTSLESIEKLMEIVAPYCQEVRERQISQAKEYASKACVFKEIQELLGVTNQQLTTWGAEIDLKTGKKTPFYDRREDFRKTCFEMYKSGMTQLEIGEELGTDRTFVGKAILEYKNDHPEEKDKTILWRQRNVDAAHREIREMQKNLVLLYHTNGLSMEKIAKRTKTTPTTVKRYLNEQGVFPKTKETLLEKQLAKLRECKEAGMSDMEISKAMDITLTEVILLNMKLKERLRRQTEKSDEMELSWNGASTTEIMGVVGRQRYSVLNDQHETSSILRHNPELLKEAYENEGNIKPHFLRSATIKLPESIEREREV